MLNINFYNLDNLYQESNFYENDKVLEILSEHRNIEQMIIESDDVFINNNPFHEENITTIDFIVNNASNVHQYCDTLIYLYPYLIYRYSNTFYDNSIYIRKCQDYLGKISSLYRNNNIEISYLCPELIRFFYNRNLDSYKQDLVNYLSKVNDNNRKSIFQYCKALLFNKGFCNSLLYYEGSQRHGSYVLYDIIIFKIVHFSSRETWLEKCVQYFEKNKEHQLNSMQDYYLLYFRLNRCVYLSYDKNTIDETLIQDFNSIKLPVFETNENVYELYSLYNQKLSFLNNIDDQNGIMDVCNYLLDILNKSTACLPMELYIKERINWLKSSTLVNGGKKQEHIDWYFEIISMVSLENLKGDIFLSPFIEQGEIEKPLYHFTDLNAMKSIIENGNLWLTRFDFLNDTEEIKYMIQIIGDSLVKNKNEMTAFIERCLCIVDFCFGNKSDDSISEDEKKIALLIKDSLSNIYVLSTSEKDDNLSLWHYYAAGTGCSIKINSKDLKAHFAGYNSPVSNKSAPIFMNKINYTDDVSQLRSLKTLQTIFKNDFLTEEHKKYIACVHIIYEGIFIKNPNMAQEEEFRVAVIAPAFHKDNQVVTKFRVSKNTFIPYIELNIGPRASIQEIRIAPLNKTDIAKKGLEEFLRNKGFNNATEMVKVSAIKLRY